MTIQDIADFCEFKDCEVSLGDPEVGFIPVDGTGVRRQYNYNRYLAHNELSGLPSPRRVLDKASVFKVRTGDQVQVFDREQFQRELQAFLEKVGA